MNACLSSQIRLMTYMYKRLPDITSTSVVENMTHEHLRDVTNTSAVANATHERLPDVTSTSAVENTTHERSPDVAKVRFRALSSLGLNAFSSVSL